MADKVDIKKIASSLSGKERARFIIKNQHIKRCEKKAGFLSAVEKEALWRMDGDYEKWEEFKKCRKTYAQAPELWLCLLYIYKDFISLYDTLREIRYMIVCSRGLRMVADVVNNYVADRKKAEVALALLEVMQSIEIKEEILDKPDKIALKDDIAQFLKNTVSEIYSEACNIVTLVALAEKINTEVGFDAFEWLEATPLRIKATINPLIEEHNNIIYQAVEDDCLENLEDYLIPEPIVNTQLYTEWEKEIFK